MIIRFDVVGYFRTVF